MSVEISGINAEKGLELYDGELEFFIFALRSWVKNTPPVLEKMHDVSAETLQDYIVNVHGVKGTSAHIGAETLREAAAELEKLAKAGDLSGVQALNKNLMTQAQALVENVQNWLKNNAPEED